MKTIAFDLHGTLAYVEDNPVLIADIEYLSELRKTYDFALVTGCNRTEATKTLSVTGLDSLFEEDKIILCEESGGEKDTGKPFEVIRERVAGPLVMIGDQPSDISGSALAGIPAVFVETAPDLEKQKEALMVAIGKAIQILED